MNPLDMKTPFVPVSWGELIDKITILEIKASRIRQEAANANIMRELSRLSDIAASVLGSGDVAALKAELLQVNTELWDIEDRIRQKEASQLFDEEFIALARSVYRKNDRRAQLKRTLNDTLASEFVEEKSYDAY